MGEVGRLPLKQPVQQRKPSVISRLVLLAPWLLIPKLEHKSGQEEIKNHQQGKTHTHTHTYSFRMALALDSTVDHVWPVTREQKLLNFSYVNKQARHCINASNKKLLCSYLRSEI